MKQKRSLKLIANFVNGYANGWYFAVRECFKDELDIKYTERIEPVIIDGKMQHRIIIHDGKETKKPLTKKVMRWTQGSSFSFTEGHVFYDTPNAYLQWNEALKQINLICTVIRAIACRTDGEGVYSKGSVTFKLAKPNSDKDGIETIGQYHLNQEDFVKLLKSGDLKKLKEIKDG